MTSVKTNKSGVFLNFKNLKSHLKLVVQLFCNFLINRKVLKIKITTFKY